MKGRLVGVPLTLRADRFLEALEGSLSPLEGTYIREATLRDHRAKVGLTDQSYVAWLDALLGWASHLPGARAPLRILDLGCGTGALTVLMNRLGHRCVGTDLHAEHLALARILAEDNGLDPACFLETRGASLPFRDGSFDLAHLHVVLEHVPDPVLPHLLAELRRVVRVGVHLIVPNRLQWTDDHTGLRGLPLLPRRWAEAIVRRQGRFRQYGISADGGWDVHYRSLPTIRRFAQAAGFNLHFPPAELYFPPLESEAQRPLHELHRVSPGWVKRLVWRGMGTGIQGWARAQNVPPEGLLPYLNLFLVPSLLPPAPAARVQR